MKDKINPPGPPSPPKCRHGLVFTMIGQCQECETEDIEIKKLVHPLIDEYWENKGRHDLYHIVYRAYRMGMRRETTREEAFQFCVKRMDELASRELGVKDKFEEKKGSFWHFGKVDIGDLLDLIYGKRNA